MNNDTKGCRREKKEKREVCRRPNKDFNGRSSDCKRCASFAVCQKRKDYSINGVDLTAEQFSNFFGG